MTGVSELLEELRQQGFELLPAGRQIMVMPASKLTDEIRLLIRDHKPELLRVLAPPALSRELERRIRAMASRWQYSNDELEDALGRARSDPVSWRACVQLDEAREIEFRDRGLFGKSDA